MIIRNMTISDYTEVYSLWSNTAGMGMRTLDDSPEGIAKFLERNPKTCFAATVQKDIAGVILCGHDGRRGYIYHTAVKPEYHRQGIGKALVESVLKALKDEGIHKVALVAYSRNQAGNAFWESQGFTVREDLVYRNRSLSLENK